MSGGHYYGAYYMGGYVLELALKAVVCRTLRLTEYPETAVGGKLKTHFVPDLVLLAGLQAELDSKLHDAGFGENWVTVIAWRPEDRYRATRTRQDVQDLIEAYEDPFRGVLTWLSSRW